MVACSATVAGAAAAGALHHRGMNAWTCKLKQARRHSKRATHRLVLAMAAIRYCYDRLSFFLSLLPIFKGKTNNNSSRTVVLSIARSSLRFALRRRQALPKDKTPNNTQTNQD
jgi:hypothetical protein